MAINKQLSQTAPLTVTLTNMPSFSQVQAWRLTGANAIIQLPNANVAASAIGDTLPAQSITLYVIPGVQAHLSTPTADGVNVTLQLNSAVGLNCVIQATTDFKTWTDVATNNPTATNATFVFPQTGSSEFYRTQIR
jgi:hypothetical protein